MNSELINAALAEMKAIHPVGSINIGVLHGHGFSSNVHYQGLCWGGTGKTAAEALEKALAQYREENPDPATAIRRRVERAREDLRRAEEAALVLGDAS